MNMGSIESRMNTGPIEKAVINATVVTPDACLRDHVIGIDRSGRVTWIGPRRSAPSLLGVKQIDAANKYVVPAALDLHVHFREPSSNLAETLQSGSAAAAAGGVVGFADMPNTEPLTTLGPRFFEKCERAQRSCLTDYSFYVTIDPNDDPQAQSTSTVEQSEGVEPGEWWNGLAGFKAFLGGTTQAHAINNEQLAMLCIAARRTRRPLTVHAEEDAVIAENRQWLTQTGESPLTEPGYHALLRDELCCVTSTCRALRFGRRFGCHIHIAHVTTAVEVELIRAAKASGQAVTAEVTLHHLWFAGHEDYERHGHYLKCNPAVKHKRDRDFLWTGLLDGTIDMIGTDHAPHSAERKQLEYDRAPSGVASAVEFLFPVLVSTGPGTQPCLPLETRLQQITQWTAERPAKIFNIQRKGGLIVGNDADFVIVDIHADPRTAEKIHSLCGHSPWKDIPLSGWPLATFLRGLPVFSRMGHEIERDPRALLFGPSNPYPR